MALHPALALVVLAIMFGLYTSHSYINALSPAPAVAYANLR